MIPLSGFQCKFDLSLFFLQLFRQSGATWGGFFGIAKIL
jgi:hypothetical protein